MIGKLKFIYRVIEMSDYKNITIENKVLPIEEFNAKKHQISIGNFF